MVSDVNTPDGCGSAEMSVFAGANQPDLPETVSLASLAEEITGPRWADVVGRLREFLKVGDRDGYDSRKVKLTAVTPAGTFSRRSNTCLIQHSGLVVIDLDDMTSEVAVTARDELGKSRHVGLAFLSPSGEGVKAFVHVARLDNHGLDAASHRAAWEAAAQHVEDIAGHPVDVGGKDVARLCFVSHDPDSRYRGDAEPLPLNMPAEPDTVTLAPVDRVDYQNAPESERRYCERAVVSELEGLVVTRDGCRNNALNKSSYSLAQLLHAGYFTEQDLADQLYEASQRVSPPMDQREAKKTIASGIRGGKMKPRCIPRLSRTGRGVQDEQVPQQSVDPGPEEPCRPADSVVTENGRLHAECVARDNADRLALREPNTPIPIMRCLADIPPEEVQWLWPGRIPLAKLTLLAGHPGLGKSTLTLAIAAAVTRGAPWPFGEGLAPQGRVILLSAEDGAADTIRPRLDAAAGDPAWVTLLEAVRVNGRERGLDLGADIEVLDQVLAQTSDVRLVVFDPISAYLGKASDNSNADMRGLLSPLTRLAQTHGCAVLLISHLRKSATGAALLRAIGSVGVVAACRAAWGVVKDPEDKDRRLLLSLKSNLAAESPGIRFGLRSEPSGNAVVTIDWNGLVHDADVDRLMGADPDGGGRPQRSSPALEEARGWLSAQLAGGEVASRELKKRARDDGLTWRTVERAKKELSIEARPGGYGQPWIWRMPDSAIDPYTVRQVADCDETPSKASNLATPTESAKWRTLQGNVADSEGTHRSEEECEWLL